MGLTNNNFQKNSNLSRVVETVWRNPGISRIDIARTINLYRSTVSNIVGILVEKGVILEGKPGESMAQGGRKPVSLSINPKFGCIIGLELYPNQYRIFVIDFEGTELFSRELKTPNCLVMTSNPEKDFICFVDEVMKDIQPFISELSLPVIGISCGMPGIIDTNKGIIIRSDPFGLEDFNFSEVFDMRYGVPFIAENDANCCGWLQLAQNKNDVAQDFLAVLARNYGDANHKNTDKTKLNGIGIGIAVVLEGRIQYGSKFSVGEYLSASWRPENKGQTGLNQQVLNCELNDKAAYTIWLRDFFASLTLLIPVLSPSMVFLHGQNTNKQQLINYVIEHDVPQFRGALKKTGTTFKIIPESPFEIAQGAANMMLQKLFCITDLKQIDSVSAFDWDDIFKLAHRERTKASLVKF
ncbi:MAG: hypothetical protein BKP49_04370 [Treponema sp. CETP13]|nr:MAG: hypothetical protein BKP49_04370 [Treponema sp. CETP13]